MNTPASTDGFTLIEMLVAISMLAIITLASTGALPALNKVNQSSSQEQRAVLLGRSAFEQARQQLEQDFDRTALSIILSGNGEGGVSCTAPTLQDLRTARVGTSTTLKPVLRRVVMACTLGTRSQSLSIDIARPM